MGWDERKLREILEQLRAFGDDVTLIECKTATGGLPEDIGKTLCAFANMPQTGVIIFGVSEREGFSVTGVDNPAQLQKALVSCNRELVKPAPQLEFSPLVLERKNVLVVEVTPLIATEKPAMYKGRAFLRQADGDYEMNANDLRMLAISALTEADRKDYDYEILEGTDVRDLDQEVLAQYLEVTRQTRSRISRIEDDAQLLQITNVADSRGNLRLAGLYAMGFLPQSTEPALGATVAVRLSREPGSQQRNKNLREIEGPVPVMLKEAMDWVRQNTEIISSYNSKGNLVDQPEFPPSAIREVLANALIHRDLGPTLDSGKKVEVRLYHNKLVITNPGGLQGVSVSQLEGASLAKAPVNKRLYEIARYIRMPDGSRVIEGEGGGIREVLTACREHRLPQPKFIDTGVQFTVIFPRGSRFSEEENNWLAGIGKNVELSPTEEDLLVTLRRYGRTSRDYVVQSYSPLSVVACENMVRKLQGAGLIDAVGNTLVIKGTPRKASANDGRTTANNAESSKLSTLGKNVPRVYNALASGEAKSSSSKTSSPRDFRGFTFKELVDKTGLSRGQVRYALDPLLQRGIAMMEGGQGDRMTSYRLA